MSSNDTYTLPCVKQIASGYSSDPSVTCQPFHFSQPTQHKHYATCAHLQDWLFQPLHLLFWQMRPFPGSNTRSYSSLLVRALKTFLNEPFPSPGSGDCAQGATGLYASICFAPITELFETLLVELDSTFCYQVVICFYFSWQQLVLILVS